MSPFSYKFKMRLWSVLHPIRTLKALYFIRNIENTERWRELVETNPKKAFEMKWNRFYRRKFPWKNPPAMSPPLFSTSLPIMLAPLTPGCSGSPKYVSTITKFNQQRMAAIIIPITSFITIISSIFIQRFWEYKIK